MRVQSERAVHERGQTVFKLDAGRWSAQRFGVQVIEHGRGLGPKGNPTSMKSSPL